MEHAVHRDREIGRDIPCTGCGYNLRSLISSGLCPECGQAIMMSLQGQTLFYCDDGWLNKQRIWIGITTALLVGHICRDLAPCLTTELVAQRLIPPALAIIDFLAMWNLSEREPGPRRHDDPTGIRLALRTAATVRVLADLSSFAIAQYMVSRLPVDSQKFWFLWTWRVLVLAWGAEIGLLFLCLRRLALRAQERSLALQLGVLAGMIPTGFLATWILQERWLGRSRSEAILAMVLLAGLGIWSAKVLAGLCTAMGKVDDGVGALKDD